MISDEAINFKYFVIGGISVTGISTGTTLYTVSKQLIVFDQQNIFLENYSNCLSLISQKCQISASPSFSNVSIHCFSLFCVGQNNIPSDSFPHDYKMMDQLIWKIIDRLISDDYNLSPTMTTLPWHICSWAIILIYYITRLEISSEIHHLTYKDVSHCVVLQPTRRQITFFSLSAVICFLRQSHSRKADYFITNYSFFHLYLETEERNFRQPLSPRPSISIGSSRCLNLPGHSGQTLQMAPHSRTHDADIIHLPSPKKVKQSVLES